MTTEHETLSEDEYWEMVDRMAEYVAGFFDDEIRAYAETGDPISEDVEDALDEKIEATVTFDGEHPGLFGLKSSDYIYLGSIVEHSGHTGFSGYYEFSHDDERRFPEGPVNAAYALRIGAIYCMMEDVREKFRELSKQRIGELQGET